MPKITPQVVPVTLKGLAQKSPPNVAVPGSMVRAENVQILKGNDSGVQFSKRYGTKRLQGTADAPAGAPGGTGVGIPNHLVTLGDDLVMDNDQGVFARDVARDVWLGYSRNGFNWGSRTDVISQTLYQKTFPSHAYNATNGNELIAWYDQAAGVRFSVRARATGAWLAHDINLSSLPFAATLKVQAFAHPTDGHFYVIYPSVAGTSMAIAKIDSATPQNTPAVFTIPLDGDTKPFDVQMNPEGQLVIAGRTPGTTDMAYRAWDPATLGFALVGGSFVAKDVVNPMWLTQTPFDPLGVNRFYYLGTVNTAQGWEVHKFDQALTFVGTTLIDAARVGGNIIGYKDILGGSPVVYIDQLIIGLTFNNSIFSGATVYQRSVNFASRAFKARDGNWYALVRYDSAIQPTLFLYDLANKLFVGKVNVNGGQWSSLSGTYGQPAWVTQIGDENLIPVQAAHTGLGQLESNPIGTQIQGVSLVDFTYSPTVSKATDLGGVLHFPGSIPWIFDAATAVEAGFNVFPEAVVISDSGGGSSKTVAATYSYRATYTWRDAKGNMYESAPSPAVNYTATTNHDLSVQMWTCRVTRRTDIAMNLYRNDPQQPSVYRLVNAAVVANVLTADSVTITDSLLDLTAGADWATRALLYNGDGGASGGTVELEHVAPPSHSLVARAQNRNFIAGIDADPDAVMFSNEYAPDDIFGQTGLSYFDGNRFRVSQPPTAVAGRDRNVVIFTAESTWVVTGEFPDATGGSFAIPTPFELPHKVGAINPNSVVVTSLGIFHQSKKGIHILGWDWSSKYIGADVEDTLATGIITAGLEVPSLHQVRLYVDSGVVLVWDTVFNVWTTYTGQSPALDATNWQSQPTFTDSVAQLWQETPGIYGDAGGFVQSLLEFSIIAPAGIRGYFCLLALQLMGKILGPHQLNASLAYNSQSFASTQYGSSQAGASVYGDVTYGVGVYGGASDDVLKLEIRPEKRQSAAYQLTVWDSLLTSGPSQGFSLEGITALLGIEPGLARTQASQRMTKL